MEDVVCEQRGLEVARIIVQKDVHSRPVTLKGAGSLRSGWAAAVAAAAAAVAAIVSRGGSARRRPPSTWTAALHGDMRLSFYIIYFADEPRSSNGQVRGLLANLAGEALSEGNR
jgi:hypothetical protein